MGNETSMRGKWHRLGLCWHCDCGGGGLLMRCHSANDGPRRTGKENPPGKTYCKRCEISRPPMKDRPKTPQTDEEFSRVMAGEKL